MSFENYVGKIYIGDTEVGSNLDFGKLSGQICIKLRPMSHTSQNEPSSKSGGHSVKVDDTPTYKIQVKQYMTRPADWNFDFMEKWNKNIPMPMRVMVGEEIKETPGMVYMKLRGKGIATITCMRCGRTLTNPISRHYGIGPECMCKLGLTANIDDVDVIKEQLADVTWEGWIIKKAIESKELVED